MNRLIAVLSLCAGTILVPAQSWASEKFQLVTKVTYRTQYLGYTNAVLILDEPVIQPSVTLVAPHGEYLQLWASYSPHGGWDSDFGDEIDIIAGKVFKLWKGRALLDINYSYYDLLPLGHYRGDLHAIFIGLEGTKGKHRPYVNVESYIPTDKSVLPGGVAYRVGVVNDVVLGNRTVQANLSLAGHDGAFGLRPERISSIRMKLSTSFKVGSMRIIPEATVQKRLGFGHSNGGMARDVTLFGATFVYP